MADPGLQFWIDSTDHVFFSTTWCCFPESVRGSKEREKSKGTAVGRAWLGASAKRRLEWVGGEAQGRERT